MFLKRVDCIQVKSIGYDSTYAELIAESHAGSNCLRLPRAGGASPRRRCYEPVRSVTAAPGPTPHGFLHWNAISSSTITLKKPTLHRPLFVLSSSSTVFHLLGYIHPSLLFYPPNNIIAQEDNFVLKGNLYLFNILY